MHKHIDNEQASPAKIKAEPLSMKETAAKLPSLGENPLD